MSWQQELTGVHLETIRGVVGGGPYVAGAKLWVRQGGAWSPVAVSGGGWRFVWVREPNDVWAIGANGQTAHRGEDGWQEQNLGRSATGVSVQGWGTAAWMTVTHGEILRHDGVRWNSWKPAALADRHTGVMWGHSPDDVWMHTHRQTTGVPPDIGHWDGRDWTFHSLSRNGYIAAMHGSGPNDVWAVGYVVKTFGKGPLAAHWDGQQWTEVSLPTRSRLTDVFVAGDGTVWISGFDGTLLRGDGTRFEAIEVPNETINGVYAEPDGTVWILVAGARVLRSK